MAGLAGISPRTSSLNPADQKSGIFPSLTLLVYEATTVHLEDAGSFPSIVLGFSRI